MIKSQTLKSLLNNKNTPVCFSLFIDVDKDYSNIVKDQYFFTKEGAIEYLERNNILLPEVNDTIYLLPVCYCYFYRKKVLEYFKKNRKGKWKIFTASTIRWLQWNILAKLW